MVVSIESLAVVLGLAAALSWGLTQIVKAAITRLRRDCAGDAFWWQWGLRCASVLIGIAVGVVWMPGEHQRYGLVLGATGGALSTWIVYQAKRYVAGRVSAAAAAGVVVGAALASDADPFDDMPTTPAPPHAPPPHDGREPGP